jgi:hypothetical protein
LDRQKSNKDFSSFNKGSDKENKSKNSIDTFTSESSEYLE